MQKVIHASLHGNAFTIEEEGYEALRAYLARAAAQLAADPDREEIIGDLEQAIADKCARHLAPHKSVVTAAEMKQVLDEMGPVGAPDGVGPAPAAAGAPATEPAPSAAPAAGPVRRLYRVLEGGKLAGLCNGLGAYFGIDANVVRVIFVILTLLTGGAWLMVYLVLVFVVPAAGTPEERAAARGLPFSAQDLIDQAKHHYATLEQELRGPWSDWKSQWRSGTREARRQARQAAHEARRAWRSHQASWSAASWSAAAGAPPNVAPGAPAHPPTDPHYSSQVWAGLLVPVVSFWSSLLLVTWVVCAAKLIVNGEILGWSPGLPLWGSLVIMLLVVAVLGRPFDAIRSALHRAPYPGAIPWLAAWEGVFWLGFIVLFGWLAWNFSPELREVVRDLPGSWAQVRDSWRASH